MNDAQKAAITTALTVLVSSALGYLAGKNYIPLALVNELAGAIVVIIVTVGGVWYNERKTKQRETDAVNAGIKESNKEPGITPPVQAEVAQAIIAINAPPVTETKAGG